MQFSEYLVFLYTVLVFTSPCSKTSLKETLRLQWSWRALNWFEGTWPKANSRLPGTCAFCFLLDSPASLLRKLHNVVITGWGFGQED